MDKIQVTFIILFSMVACLPFHIVSVKATSTSELCMEVESGRVLYENNINQKRFMASTTKILTAIVVIENCNMSDIITVKRHILL
jgi:D-alanyl-D-alanine carboxypeptidase